jgi:hypothetical protein
MMRHRRIGLWGSVFALALTLHGGYMRRGLESIHTHRESCTMHSGHEPGQQCDDTPGRTGH